MILETHEVPEGGHFHPGFNLWDGDGSYTDFRLVYRSDSSCEKGWYFRIRSKENVATPRFIFRWENE